MVHLRRLRPDEPSVFALVPERAAGAGKGEEGAADGVNENLAERSRLPPPRLCLSVATAAKGEQQAFRTAAKGRERTFAPTRSKFEAIERRARAARDGARGAELPSVASSLPV